VLYSELPSTCATTLPSHEQPRMSVIPQKRRAEELRWNIDIHVASPFIQRWWVTEQKKFRGRMSIRYAMESWHLFVQQHIIMWACVLMHFMGQHWRETSRVFIYNVLNEQPFMLLSRI
jgi:hypothetical protein